MNIPHDFSCHEGSKNVYFIQVRNLEGLNHLGHTVYKDQNINSSLVRSKLVIFVLPHAGPLWNDRNELMGN